MIVRYLGDTTPGALVNGKKYEVLAVEKEVFYRIIDESNEDYLYHKDNFEIVEK